MRRRPTRSSEGSTCESAPRTGRACAGCSASRKAGKLRFALLVLTLIATAVIVTIVMFQTLAMLAG